MLENCLVDLGRDTRPSTQSRRLVRRKGASWSLNWPSGANLLAHMQLKCILRPAALAKTINEVRGQLFSTLFREKKNWANQQELEKKKKTIESHTKWRVSYEMNIERFARGH